MLLQWNSDFARSERKSGIARIERRSESAIERSEIARIESAIERSERKSGIARIERRSESAIEN
jgi:hypothetical protein